MPRLTGELETAIRLRSGKLLLGSWKRGSHGRWEPDHEGDYSAFLVGDVLVVTFSLACAWAAPSTTYPGFADLSKPGAVLAYVPPWELFEVQVGSDE